MKNTQRQFRSTVLHHKYLPEVEAPTPTPTTTNAPQVPQSDDQGKSVPSEAGTSANPTPLAGQVRMPMDSGRTDYYTETTDPLVHHDNEAQRHQTIREIVMEMKK
jgi:hypothetical protein